MVLVEDEVRVGLARVGAVLNAAPVVEEEVAVAGALDALEEAWLVRMLMGCISVNLEYKSENGFRFESSGRLW